MMKAAVYEEYGSADVLEIRDIARPDPADDEVLVKVHAAEVTTADWRLRASAFPGILWLPGRLMVGLFRPKNHVLGAGFSGRVVARGENVTRFRLGDPVYGFSGSGAHAEYLTMKVDGPVVAKPANLSFEEAAAVPFGALSALVFLRDFAKVQAGERALVVGATGGVGVWMVQLARHFGVRVTAVTSSANATLAHELGADRVIDYRREDVWASGEIFDLVVDPVGKSTFARARGMLARSGRYVPLNFGGREILRSLLAPIMGGPKIVIGISGDTRGDL